MTLRMFALVFCVSASFAVPSLAASRDREIGVIQNKSLGSASGLPVWTKDNVDVFCTGRMKTVRQDKALCIRIHTKSIGHDMTPADVQELKEFQRLVDEEKAQKKGDMPNVPKDEKPKVEKPKKDVPVNSTILQPPLRK